MAFENVILAHSFVVSGNSMSLDSAQFRFVAIGSNKRVAAAGAGVRTLGIAQGTARTNKAIAVAFSGSISKARCGSTPIKAGIFLGSDANGMATPARGGCAVGAYSLEDAVSGDILSVLLTNGSL